MQLAAITTHLTGYHSERITAAVDDLKAAVATGIVPNKLFTEAKDIINHAVETSAEAFLQTGPHEAKHHQSDWWLAAYDADAFVRGAHTLPTVLKRAQKRGLTHYAAFISALLPLRDLLETAKPLIKKKGELPKIMTAKQIADDALRMTCQCCGRRILANMGTIAHHGYERPDSYYQTASCGGAKELPFEVSRDALGRQIEALKNWEINAVASMAAVANGLAPVVIHVTDKTQPRDRHTGKHPTKPVEVTRANFDAVKATTTLSGDFDDLKAKDIDGRSREIKSIRDDINAQQARYDGWKQTHKREGDHWVAL
jgi:hypothetical protein